jgi:methylmalonyl-CoA/ethylmalonyl-CoA epimerase
MVKKIDHVGIAVKSLQDALAVFSDALGMKVTSTEVVEGQKVKVAFLPAGEATIELLEPTDPTSNIATFIESRGEGIHHIAVEVDDIVSSLGRLKEKGVKVIHSEPVPGAHGTRIAFIHPKAVHGVLMELVEKTGKGH